MSVLFMVIFSYGGHIMMKRNQLLLEVMKNIDIPPYMAKYALDRYKAIYTYLAAHGLNVTFYPQGSFRQGTVVRPMQEESESDFDLDAICEFLPDDNNSLTAKYVKQIVKDTLALDEVYKEKLTEESTNCWTLKYEGASNDVGFRLDVLPAANYSYLPESLRLRLSQSTEYTRLAIAITEKGIEGDYSWGFSNPKGFAAWFDKVNQPFLEAVSISQRESIYKTNLATFNSPEDVPVLLVRSSLQRVIQILKRHRRIYYCRRRVPEKEPSSFFLTVLAAEYSKSSNPLVDFYELLEYVTRLASNNFTTNSISGGKLLSNPIDLREDLLADWDKTKLELFIDWIKELRQDLIGSHELDLPSMIAIKNSLGKEPFERAVPEFKAPDKQISIASQPWLDETNEWKLLRK